MRQPPIPTSDCSHASIISTTYFTVQTVYDFKCGKWTCSDAAAYGQKKSKVTKKKNKIQYNLIEVAVEKRKKHKFLYSFVSVLDEKLK